MNFKIYKYLYLVYTVRGVAYLQMWYTFIMSYKHVRKIWTALACIVALYFVVYAIIFAHRASRVESVVEIDSASLHIRSELVSYTAGPLLVDPMTSEDGNEQWTDLANAQILTHMTDVSTVVQIPSDPNVFVYRLDYADNKNSTWVAWYDDGSTALLVGDDITVALPIPGQQEGIVLTERVIQKSEIQPLVRGYQVEGGEVKFTITRTPVFVYVKEE